MEKSKAMAVENNEADNCRKQQSGQLWKTKRQTFVENSKADSCGKHRVEHLWRTLKGTTVENKGRTSVANSKADSICLGVELRL